MRASTRKPGRACTPPNATPAIATRSREPSLPARSRWRRAPRLRPGKLH